MKKDSITTFLKHIGFFLLPIIFNPGCSIFLFLSFIRIFHIDTSGHFNFSGIIIALVSTMATFLITLLIALNFRGKLGNYFITVLLGDVFIFITGMKLFVYFNLI